MNNTQYNPPSETLKFQQHQLKSPASNAFTLLILPNVVHFPVNSCVLAITKVLETSLGGDFSAQSVKIGTSLYHFLASQVYLVRDFKISPMNFPKTPYGFPLFSPPDFSINSPPLSLCEEAGIEEIFEGFGEAFL